MEYSIDIDRERRLVCVVPKGTLRADEMSDLRLAVANEVIDSDARSIVVDARQSTLKMSTMELYHFGESFVSTSIPRGTKIAILVNEQYDDNHFIATVASNRGFHIRDFLSEDEAYAWLA